MARPSKYNETIQKKANDYLKNHEKYGDVVPSTCGLAVFLDISEKTCYNWGDAHPIFLQTLDGIQAKQKNLLLNKGLSGDFQPTIAKLMLANHGFHEKQDIDMNAEVNIPKVEIEFVKGND